MQFGDGTYRIGADIPAGTYRTRYDAESCYWERLRGFSGTLADIIANEFSDDHQVVTIAGTDAGFSTDGCDTWTSDLSALTASPTSPIGDGMWIVHTDMAPGTWSAPGGSRCYWARLGGFSGELKDIKANGLGDTTPIVTISESDIGFESSGCGSWNLPGNSGTAGRLTPPAPEQASAAPVSAAVATTLAPTVLTSVVRPAPTGSLARTGMSSRTAANVIAGMTTVIIGLGIAHRARRSEFEKLVARWPVRRGPISR